MEITTTYKKRVHPDEDAWQILEWTHEDGEVVSEAVIGEVQTERMADILLLGLGLPADALHDAYLVWLQGACPWPVTTRRIIKGKETEALTKTFKAGFMARHELRGLDATTRQQETGAAHS